MPPWKYQLLPLSATINPYCCMAMAMTLAWPVSEPTSKLELNRSRMPIAGNVASVLLDAKCVAGSTKPACVCEKVTRIAWLMRPAATSSYFTKPGRIGSPAASPECSTRTRFER